MNADRTKHLHHRVATGIDVAAHPAITAFAAMLGEDAGARAVLFYGSNLRTGSLEGVLDFYVLLPGDREERIWPRVSYHERVVNGHDLRAKVATMTLATFARAARGETLDTTIWARFVQPSALAWCADQAVRADIIDAIAAACVTAARLAVVLGPGSGTQEDYWRALFRATYAAEFRIEKRGRENDILTPNGAHFDALLPLALQAGGIAFTRHGRRLSPSLSARTRTRVRRWWNMRRRLGKPLNLLRLAKASATFEGAARYGAWKIERHTGMPVEVTPFRERHPLLGAPGVFRELHRYRKNQG